jgi:MoxR-like ATPase
MPDGQKEMRMAKKVLEIKSANGNKLQAIANALKTNFKERDSVVDALMVTALSQENILLLGLPGTAKSAITEAFTAAVGGNSFQVLVSKTTVVDEIVGAPSVEDLIKGQFKRNTKNSIQEAHVAFIDEIFKCNSATLNALLSIANERTFTENGVAKKLPLQMIVGASNELPEAKELAAFNNRFTLRLEVKQMQEDDSVKSMLKKSGKVDVPSISMEELAEAQKQVDEVADDDAVIDALLNLRRAIQNEGLYISDRKLNKAYKVMKAHAHYRGRTAVSLDDIEILEHVLWEDDPSHHKLIKKLIARFTNPVGEKIVEFTDAAREQYENWNNAKADAMEAGIALGKIVKGLEGLGKSSENEKLAQAISLVKDLRMKVLDGTPAGKK